VVPTRISPTLYEFMCGRSGDKKEEDDDAETDEEDGVLRKARCTG